MYTKPNILFLISDDPGGGKPQAMDEIKYLSNVNSQANIQVEITQQNQIHDNHHNHHHHKYSNTHVSDLKYLHKKFKRIASATVVDNINTPVIDSRPINSNELKLNSFSQSESKREISDQSNQLNNISESRLTKLTEQVMLLPSTIQHKTPMHEDSQKKDNQTTTTVLNGFNCSNTKTTSMQRQCAMCSQGFRWDL